jgi:signal transduction histidine kinase
MNPRDLTPSGYISNLYRNIKKIKETGKASFEDIVKTRDGKIIILDITTKFLEINGFRLIIVNARDITKRKRLEDRLSNFKKFAPDAFFLYDSDLNLLDINKFGIDLLPGKYKKDDIIGKNIKEIFPLIQETDRIDNYMNVLNTGCPFFRDEIEIHPKFGNIFLSVRAFKVGEDLGVILSDITERKKIEQKLIESEEKYRKAYNRAELYKDLFSHDIKNILQAIIASVEISERYFIDSNKKKLIKNNFNIIKSQVIRASNLVHNIHVLSHVENIIPKIKELEILEILDHSISNIKQSTMHREIYIKKEISLTQCYIHANELLQYVFDNILHNAIIHNENQIIKIIIKISRIVKDNRDYIKIEFLDNGRGIEDSIKKTIFERDPYNSLNIRRRGIGLILVKRIVDIFSGNIWIENRVENDYKKGSNFILLFPHVKNNY